MAITAPQQLEIYKLAVGMYNGSPGVTYFNELAAAIEAGSTKTQIYEALANSPSFQNLNFAYNAGSTNDQFANTFADNVLGSNISPSARTTAVNYLLGKLNPPAGESRGSVMAQAIELLYSIPSSNPDFGAASARLHNRIDVATHYTEDLGGSETDIALLQATIATVTDDPATVTAAENNNASAVSETFPLTTGVDTLTGTGSFDTFNAQVSALTPANNTFNAADTLNGGNGADRLNIVALDYTNADTLAPASVSAIETVNIRAIDLDSTTDVLNVNAASFTGATAVNSDRSSSAIAVTNLATGAAAGIIGNGSTTNGASSFGWATAAADATLNLSGGTLGTGAVTITSDPTQVTINSSGAANVVGAVDLSASASVTSATLNAATNLSVSSLSNDFSAALTDKLTVTGAATLVTLGTLPVTLDIVDASGMTAGGLSATLAASGLQTVTGGAGNDTITTNGVLTTGSVAADGGTGDRLVVANAADLATAALGAKYTGFESLQVNDGVAVDLDDISGITSAILNDGAGTTALVDLSATAAAAVRINALNAAATIGVKNATTLGTIDTLNLTVSDGDSTTSETLTTAGDLTLAGVETLNITATDDLTLATMANVTGLTTLTVAGAGDVSIITGAHAVGTNAVFNFSGLTSAVTFNATGGTGNGLAVTGSAQGDALTGTAQADAITGGAGGDTLAGLAGADTYVFASTGALNGADVFGANIVGGGAGGDILNFSAFLPGGTLNSATATECNGAADVNFSNKAIFLASTNAGVAEVDTSAEVAALIQGAGNALSLNSGGKGIIIAGDDSAATAGATIYFVNDTLDGIAGTVSATDVVIVGTATLDIDTLLVANFVA